MRGAGGVPVCFHGVRCQHRGQAVPKQQPVVTRDRPLRIALLSYRSKPHCGGQGVYVRHLSRELDALGHQVEVFSGQPYPELDPGPRLTQIPSLDLYRDPDPFRTPHWDEYRDWVDVLETVMMWAGGFPEPLTFSSRARVGLHCRWWPASTIRSAWTGASTWPP